MSRARRRFVTQRQQWRRLYRTDSRDLRSPYGVRLVHRFSLSVVPRFHCLVPAPDAAPFRFGNP